MALTKISTGGVKDDAISQAVIADESIDEARLQISNSGSNGQFLSKQSGNTGGLTWASANQYTHPNHSGEVTSTADGAQVIADNIVDEAILKVSNAPTNGHVLTAQSGNTGGLTWAAPGGGMWKKMAGADVAAGTSSSDYDIFTDFASHTDKKWWKLVFRLESPSGNNDFSGSGLRVKVGGAWKTSDYRWQQFYASDSSEVAENKDSQSRYSFTTGDEKWHRGEVTFYDPNATDYYKIFEYTGISADHNWHSANDMPWVERSAGGYVGGTEAIQGIRFNHYGNTWGKIHFALFAGDGW